MQHSTINTEEPLNTYKNMDAFFLHKSSVISCFTYSYDCGNSILLKFLDKNMETAKGLYKCHSFVLFLFLMGSRGWDGKIITLFLLTVCHFDHLSNRYCWLTENHICWKEKQSFTLNDYTKIALNSNVKPQIFNKF